MLPIDFPHPPGFTNPVIARVSAALPAVGAWDAAPTEFSTMGARDIALSFSYTRGAVGGAFDFQLLYSIYADTVTPPAGAGEWSTEVIFQGGGVVPGVDTQSRIQKDYQTFQPAGAAQEVVIYVVHLKGAIERMQVLARESGVVGTPGTLQITANLVR
jgi:hypothetical protein